MNYLIFYEHVKQRISSIYIFIDIELLLKCINLLRSNNLDFYTQIHTAHIIIYDIH